MRQSVRHQAWIVLAAVVVFFTNLGATRLWDQDEAYFARCAVEMHQRGEWVVPYFNDEVFAHKPPFMFWMMRLGFELFGVNEFGARFFSGVFGLANALLVYHLGKRLFSPQVGFWAGLAMTTCLMPDVVARAATPDTFLVFFATLAVYVFARREVWEESQNAECRMQNAECVPLATPLIHARVTVETTSEPPLAVSRLPDPLAAPLPWKLCAMMYAVMGLAVLVKGPIGIVLPGLVIALYFLVKHPLPTLPLGATLGDRFRQFAAQFAPGRAIRTLWRMRPFTAIGAVLLVAGPWFVLVGIQTNGEFLRDFFGVHNYGRFLNAMDNHNGPIWYYVPIVLMGFFPWSIFGIPTMIDLVRRVRGAETGQRAAKLLACWIVVWIGFFSLASTKLPNYVLPAYPALALAMSCFLNRWLTRPERATNFWPRLSFASLALVGGGMLALRPFLASKTAEGVLWIEKLGATRDVLDDLKAVGVLGGILLVGAVVCFVFAETGRRHSAAIALAATATAFCLVLFAGVAVQFDRHQPTPDLAAAIQRLSPTARPHIAEHGYFRPSLIYYADNRVEQFNTGEQAGKFLQQWDDAFVVVPESLYVNDIDHFPAGVVVMARRAEFPKGGTIVVLGRPANLAKLPTGPLR